MKVSKIIRYYDNIHLDRFNPTSPIIEKYSEGVENMFIRIKVITIMKHLAMVY